MGSGEDFMRRLHPWHLAPLFLAGCLTPLTDRLDQANGQIALSNQMLADANQQLVGAMRELETANKRLEKVDEQMTEMNRKLGTVEQGIHRFFGGKMKQ